MNVSSTDRPAQRGPECPTAGRLFPAVPVELGPSRVAAVLREQLDRAAGASRIFVHGPRGSGHAAAALALHARGERASGPLITMQASEGELTDRLVDAARRGATLHIQRLEQLDGPSQESLATALDRGPLPAGLVTSSELDLLGPDRPPNFDEELAYALNVATVTLPALEDRLEDLPDLAHAAAGELARRRGRDLTLSEAATRALAQRPWPGNLEELELVLARAVLVARGDRIEPADLGLVPQGSADALPLTDRRLETVERALIERVLEETAGNRSLAARLLGINRSTLYNKLRAWGVR